MYVFTGYDGKEVVAMVVDGAPPGPLGRLFVVPPNEVVEVPDIAGNELIHHKGYLGVVRVNVIKSKTGIEYDIEQAVRDSSAAIEEADLRRWEQYVASLIEDRVSKQKAVPPPPQSMREIMARRGWTLESYGIKPMGTAEQNQSAAMTALQAENAALKSEISDIKKMLEGLTEGKKVNRGRGKASVAA